MHSWSRRPTHIDHNKYRALIRRATFAPREEDPCHRQPQRRSPRPRIHPRHRRCLRRRQDLAGRDADPRKNRSKAHNLCSFVYFRDDLHARRGGAHIYDEIAGRFPGYVASQRRSVRAIPSRLLGSRTHRARTAVRAKPEGIGTKQLSEIHVFGVRSQKVPFSRHERTRASVSVT
jgi:hypothetical protein